MPRSVQGYTPTAIGLHWLIALLIFAAFPLGVYMTDLPFSPSRLKLYSYHKWLGVTVFMLAVLRVLWRLAHAAPPPVAMPAWQRITSVATHHLLYLLVLAVPISGWLMSSALGMQTVYLGVIPLPDLLARDKALGDQLVILHKALNLSMAVLVLAHVLGALKHYFIDKDAVLGRMLPFLAKRRS